MNNKIGKCPCDIPNSHCELQTTRCACDEGFVKSHDEMRCITMTVKISQPCEMNEQCTRFDKNSYCFNGTCQCLENFTEHDHSCRSLVKIGQYCTSHQECQKFTTNALCSDHKCLCDKGFVTSDDGHVSHLSPCIGYLLIFLFIVLPSKCFPSRVVRAEKSMPQRPWIW